MKSIICLVAVFLSAFLAIGFAFACNFKPNMAQAAVIATCVICGIIYAYELKRA